LQINGLKVTFQVATLGAESAVYDCLVTMLTWALESWHKLTNTSSLRSDMMYIRKDEIVSGWGQCSAVPSVL